MDLVFIIIAVTAFNLTDWFKGPLQKLNVNPVVLLQEGRESWRKCPNARRLKRSPLQNLELLHLDRSPTILSPSRTNFKEGKKK